MATITIRLHRQHDMDLISLYKNKTYHIAKEMKRVLVAYAANETYLPASADAAKFLDGYIPTSIVVHITLSEKNKAEAQALELLKHVKMGYRCSFIKAVFRSACAYLPLLAYSASSGFVMARPKSPILVAMDSFDVKEAESEDDKLTDNSAKLNNITENKANNNSNVQIEPQIKILNADDEVGDLNALFSQMDKLGR